MFTIDSILRGLTPTAQQRLIYALNNGQSSYISVQGGHFIGVNVKGIPHLQIELEKGEWAYGSIQVQVSNYTI